MYFNVSSLVKITCMFIACLSCIFVILLNKFNSIQFNPVVYFSHRDTHLIVPFRYVVMKLIHFATFFLVVFLGIGGAVGPYS